MKILFLAGPSGSGKSHFASQYLAGRGWLHLEIDQHDQGDGIDLENLRSQWDDFWIRHDPSPLREELRRRAAGAPDMVLSFASSVVFSADHLHTAAGQFCVTYLYGPPQFCLQAFLDRERSMPRELAISHWDKYNRETFGELSLSRNQPLLIEVFRKDGSRRDPKEIYADITSRMHKLTDASEKPAECGVQRRQRFRRAKRLE
jgi:hypothetical protein